MLINIISIIWSNNKGQLVQQAIERSTNNCLQAFSNGCQVFEYIQNQRASTDNSFSIKAHYGAWMYFIRSYINAREWFYGLIKEVDVSRYVIKEPKSSIRHRFMVYV